MSELPNPVTTNWVLELKQKLHESSWKDVSALKTVLPKDLALNILQKIEAILQKEPPLLEITPPTPDTTVVVVGDTHGQFHDVCNLIDLVGQPSHNRIYIFNGDFVDRGAWGMETLILLCCWKLALPRHVHLIRGNHETATCSIMYGFKGELDAKYGKSIGKTLFAACKRAFAAMPLAAVVNRKTLVLHGGLFRRPVPRVSGKQKRKLMDECIVGSLNDIKHASKGGLDPSGLGTSRLCSDIIWSDPSNDPGFIENDARGIGMVFGPDITEQFLRENNLSLVLRSHEGPDARSEREGMGKMLEGYTEDHVTASGRLFTVFSAPDYPQFIPDETPRYKNKGAVAVLSSPDYIVPQIIQFEAVLPRPQASPYYDLYVNDSDEEFEPQPSTASGMTDVREERENGGDEVDGGSVDSVAHHHHASMVTRRLRSSLSPKAAVDDDKDGDGRK